MPDLCTYDYAIVRVVPHVDRGEFVNAGVIVACAQKGFLKARIALDEARLLALDPEADVAAIQAALAAIPATCAGGAAAGPIGRLSVRLSTLRFSCDNAITGHCSSLAKAFRPREISPISVARFSSLPELPLTSWM